MPVLIVLVALVVLAVVVFAALGRGGGLSVERNDYVPLDLGPVSATDVALLRPPTGVWGYNMQVTDEAMERIAESIRERDVRIVALEQLVTDLSRDHAPMAVPLASPYAGARHRREAAEAGQIQAGTVTAGPVSWGPGQPGMIEYAHPGPGRPSFDYAGPEFARLSIDHPGPDAVTKPDPVHPAFAETAIDQVNPGPRADEQPLDDQPPDDQPGAGPASPAGQAPPPIDVAPEQSHE